MFKLMNESVIAYRPEMKAKGIQLDFKINSECPMNLTGDFIRLKQIIGNLVLNAIVHAQASAIELGCALKQMTPDHAEIMLYVKDNGIGMSEKTQMQIFNMFYKKDNNSPGTGLGLPICKELVNLMGGQIWVESEKDKGSIFYFSIPFRFQKADDAMRKTGENKDPQLLKDLHILLAEDNAINQALVLEMLKPKGIAVTTVQNGAEALKALKSDPFDLILMDIQMPIMNGLEATKRIRAAQNPVPIIVLTGSVLPQEKEAFLTGGAADIIEKPIFLDVLLEKMSVALSIEMQ